MGPHSLVTPQTFRNCNTHHWYQWDQVGGSTLQYRQYQYEYILVLARAIVVADKSTTSAYSAVVCGP